jgi:hypothetical protein
LNVETQVTGKKNIARLNAR